MLGFLPDNLGNGPSAMTKHQMADNFVQPKALLVQEVHFLALAKVAAICR